METLVKNVIKNADANKLLFATLERTYYDLYMYHFLQPQHVSIKSNDKGCNFELLI